jgi:hypothetical protein
LAFLDKLERVMCGRPENLGLYSGIWFNVGAVAALERQKRLTKGSRRND